MNRFTREKKVGKQSLYTLCIVRSLSVVIETEHQLVNSESP